MAFVRKTWVAGRAGGTPFNAADSNRIEQAIDDLYNKTAFKVYRNAAFNVTDGTLLAFDAAEYDPDALFTVASSKFTCPKPGLWSLWTQYNMGGAPGSLDTYYGVRWRKTAAAGGAQTLYESVRVPNRGQPIVAGGALYVALLTGDTLEALTTINQAIAATAILTGPGNTWMGGHLVRAT